MPCYRTLQPGDVWPVRDNSGLADGINNVFLIYSYFHMLNGIFIQEKTSQVFFLLVSNLFKIVYSFLMKKHKNIQLFNVL